MSRYFTNKLKNLTPYTPGEQPKDMEYIKLNTNESPFPPSKRGIELCQEGASVSQLYPDPDCTELTKAVASSLGVKKENVMKLCIGLELTLEQAKEFMASESYDFSPSKMLDVVIKSCLYHRIYNPICVNIELAENGLEELFVEN